jgi:flagellar assembly protein FliH
MARVMKQAAAGTATRFTYQDFEQQCRALVARAREQAEAIVADARATAQREAETIRTTAHAEALAAGREAGLAEIRAAATEQVLAERQEELTTAVTALGAALAAYQQHKHTLIAQAERGVLELAVAIARRVCKHIPPIDIDAARENCRTALETVGRAGDVELRVAPAELEQLRAWANAFVDQCDQLENVALVADAAVTPGGCVAQGRDVRIDATLETQLERVAAALLGPAPAPTSEETAP